MVRGSCTKMMSGEQFEVNEQNKLDGKSWWDMRPAMIQMPPDTWAELKKWILTMCKKTNACGDAELIRWERTTHTIDEQLEEKAVIP